MSRATKHRLGELLTRMDRFEHKDDATEYQFAGTYSYGRGIFVGDRKIGGSFGLPKVQRIRANDFVYCKIMAWEQAIAIAKPEDESCVGNHQMLACEANPKCAAPGFIWYYFTTPDGFDKIYAASPGTAARNRTMTAPALMTIEVPMPPLATQQTFDRLQIEVAALKTKHAAIRKANAALLPATLERVFA